MKLFEQGSKYLESLETFKEEAKFHREKVSKEKLQNEISI